MNEQPNQDVYRDEYKLVFEGCKFFSSLRFITAAFMMSIHSALLTLYNQAMKDKSFSNDYAIFVVALVFWVALFIVELRTTSIFRSFIDRGIEIEFQLGIPNSLFHKIDELSKVKGVYVIIRHGVGIKIVYAGIILLWLALVFVTLFN